MRQIRHENSLISVVINYSLCIVAVTAILAGGCAHSRKHPARPAWVPYPPAPAVTRVVALGSVGHSLLAGSPPSRLKQFVTGESEADVSVGLIRPISVAVRDGELLVCDVALKAVVRIDPIAATIKPLIASDQPQPDRPVAVAVDHAGVAYIADAAGGQILAVSAQGEVTRFYRLPQDQGLFKPIALVVVAERLYVVNREARCVEVFELDSGEYVERWAEGMALPVAISADAKGRLYVVDIINCAVLMYDRQGKKLGAIGGLPGQLARPRSVAVSDNDIVYVSDAATQVVQMFDTSGRLLMHFGGPGTGPGTMVLPAGLCLDRSMIQNFSDWMPSGFVPRYLLFVASQFGPGRIGVYAFGRFEKENPPASAPAR